MNKPFDKYRKYEQAKRDIAATAKTPEEYEKRIKAIARKLGV